MFEEYSKSNERKLCKDALLENALAVINGISDNVKLRLDENICLFTFD